MAYEDVLVHRATPLLSREEGVVVEGDSLVGDALPGTPFDCCLFLPPGQEEGGTPRGGSRQVRRPTLLVAAADDLGEPVALSFKAELLIVAPELNVAEGLAADLAVRWQVDGSPQPFGRPGDDVIGYQVTLQRVEE